MQINLKIKLGIIFLVFILSSGCLLRYKDVSSEPEYNFLLGTRYTLVTNMLIYGVNLPPGYGKEINVYIITPDIAGMTGPEIIVKDHLHLGTILKIQSVRKSVNHLPGWQSIEAIVLEDSYTKNKDIPVVIDLKYIQSTNYMRRLE